MKAFHQFISGVFHPLFLPTYLCLLTFVLKPFPLLHYESRHQLLLIGIVFLSTCILPAIISLWYIWSSKTKDYFLERRSSRTLPYLSFAFNAFIAYIFLKQQGVHILVLQPLLGASLLVSAIILINVFWKISAHGAGVGGSLGLLYAYRAVFLEDPFLLFIGIVLVLGIVGLSRISLKAHTLAQFLAGALLGALVLYLVCSLAV